MSAFIPASPRAGRSVAAFTLIELLVSVAIISLLLAVLLPGLRNARIAARRVACQANLRHLAMAWHNYLSTYDDHFLQGPMCEDQYGGKQGDSGPDLGADPNDPLPKPLNTFLRLPDVLRDSASAGTFRCPDDRGSERVSPSFFDYRGTSYRMNHMLVGQDYFNLEDDDPAWDILDQVRSRLRNLSRTRIGNESRLLLMGDYGWRFDWYWLTPRESLVTWHGKAHRHNMAFMDGHAEFVWIRKGLHSTKDYTVIPFPDLASAVVDYQQEVPLGQD